MYIKNNQMQKLYEAIKQFKNSYENILEIFGDYLPEDLKVLNYSKRIIIPVDKYNNNFGSPHYKKDPQGFNDFIACDNEIIKEPFWSCCSIDKYGISCQLNTYYNNVLYDWFFSGRKLEFDKILDEAKQMLKNRKV